MKAVNVSELESSLQLYLNAVQAGERIEVLDRERLIALIVPPPAQAGVHDDELVALAAQGKIKLGQGKLDESFWELPAPSVPMEVIQRALEEDRNED